MTDIVVRVEGAQWYSFTDDKTGRLVQGVNVFHLVDAGENGVGKIPSKITLPFEVWDSISRFPFPCDCKLITKQEFTRKGILTKVIGLKMVR